MHSGRTDNKGGHNDRINGGYHYHHGREAHSHINGVCELDTPNKTDSNYFVVFILILLGIYLLGLLVKRLK